MTLENIGVIVAIVISIFGTTMAVLKSKPDLLKLDAETSEIFQEMLAKEVKKGIARNNTILGMKTQIACLEAELESLCNERDALKDWADKLVKQVVAAGRTPAKYRRHTA